MAEYIKRNQAVDILIDKTQLSGRPLEDAVNAIRDLPAADVVEVRHAHWRDIQPPDQDNNVQCWCSACGAGELHADGMIVPYCWNCGAKMDGGEDDA